jgi:Type-F conjugative transfer system protein (TrbI_Ftype)
MMASKAQRAEELPFEGGGQGAKVPPSAPLSRIGYDRTASTGVDIGVASLGRLAALRQTRRFAGFTYDQLGIGVLILVAAIWGMWATSKIFALENRRVVSVRLAAIVNDFVSAEARSGTPPEQLEPRTRAFMTALDSVLKKRAEGGQVVLVGEAVIASSVPDVTRDVVAALSKIVRMPVAIALPPAIPSLGAPSAPPAPVGQQMPPPTAGTDPSPFGGAALPADSGTQQ